MTLTTADDYDNPPIVYDAFGGRRQRERGRRRPRRRLRPRRRRRGPRGRRRLGRPVGLVVDGVVRADQARRPRCCPSRCATPTARRPSPRSTSRPRGRPALRPARVPHRARLRGQHDGQGLRLHRRARRGRVRLLRPPLVLRLADRPDRRPGRQPVHAVRPAGFRGRARCSSRSRPRPTPAATRTPRPPRTASPPSCRSRWSSGTTPRRRVPHQRHPDVGRPALRPRHRDLLQGLHRRPPRRRRTRLHRRVEPGRRRRRRRQPAGLGRRGHGLGRRHGGRRGRPHVRAGESNTQEVRFRLAQAPPPRLLPIRVETMEAGQSRPTTSAPTSRPGCPTPEPTIVTVQNTGTPGVRAASTAAGSRRPLTATPGRGGELPARRQRRLRRRPAVLAHGRGAHPVHGHRHAVASR